MPPKPPFKKVSRKRKCTPHQTTGEAAARCCPLPPHVHAHAHAFHAVLHGMILRFWEDFLSQCSDGNAHPIKSPDHLCPMPRINRPALSQPLNHFCLTLLRCQTLWTEMISQDFFEIDIWVFFSLSGQGECN